MEKQSLRRALAERVLLLDGAMGTEIQRRALTEADFRGDILADSQVALAGNNDLLALTRPDVIAEIHRSYLDAGADIITTCTFNAQRFSQAEYGATHLVEAINRSAARIAVAEAERAMLAHPSRPRYVAGSVGPTPRMLSIEEPGSDFTFASLVEAYTEQMIPLIEEGVDALLIETIVDTLNAKAAICAAQDAMQHTGRRVEIMLSMTLADDGGRTLSGQTLEAFVISVMHARPLSIGLNCSFGVEAMSPWLRRLSAVAPCYVSVHPNAGLPDDCGCYNDTPQQMSQGMAAWFDDSLANIVGGCCGTGPEHIAALRVRIDASDTTPRAIPALAPALRLSGLMPMVAEDVFVNVGERCNVAGSRKFLRLINEKNYSEALDIARRQVEDGAMLLDINMDDGMLDSGVEMEAFLRLVATDPAICSVPLMIDSSRFDVIERALTLVQGKCVVNSLSLKEGEEAFLGHARRVRSLGAALVVMAFDEEGQAVTFERKIQIMRRAYDLLVNHADYDPYDIIFDPNILTVATGMAEHADYALDYVRAAEWAHQHLPGVRISGGLSNLSFAFRGNNFVREAMHAVFLYHAVNRGMDMAIMNPATRVAYADVPDSLRVALEDVLFGSRTQQATEALITLAAAGMAEHEAGVGESGSRRAAKSDSHISPLAAAIISGDPSALPALLDEALGRGDAPLDIISGPLMEGMNEVGRRFGEGKMFLPQVVKTARTMRAAVDRLTPLIKSANADTSHTASSSSPLVIATVRGDVHDIGKNIVGVILACNGYDVIDLGVMVPTEQIVDTAIERGAAAVLLSGLISPSLEAMCEVAETMQRRGLSIPLIIGGATTSATHTAVKIAPLYTSGPVVHVRDAAQEPAVIAALLDADRAEGYMAEIRHEQERLRCERAVREANTDSSPEVSLAHRFRADFSCAPHRVPWLGVKALDPIPVADLIPEIDWRYFRHAWRVMNAPEESDALIDDAQALLAEMLAPEFAPRARVGFFAARGTEDAIVVDTPAITIPTPRQAYDGKRSECLALCDFVAPEGDVVGAFGVTMAPAFVAMLEKEKGEGGDQYRSMLLQTVGDRLAEAAASLLHRRLKERYGWGGIRPAAGYPSLPDMSSIFAIDRLIDLGALGITLTTTGAMYPQASIAGLYLPHPQARYFVL